MNTTNVLATQNNTQTKNTTKRMSITKQLTPNQAEELIQTLSQRFEKNKKRHPNLDWLPIKEKLEQNPSKLWSLFQMEETGGEPDVIAFNPETNAYTFCDCSSETPKGRRSVCYDPAALASRKEYKPKHSAIGMAQEMNISLLTEQQYAQLQQLEPFDQKTSSWLLTPEPVRKLGGAIFGDTRYGRVFTYHNGAESYYAARGFRGMVIV